MKKKLYLAVAIIIISVVFCSIAIRNSMGSSNEEGSIQVEPGINSTPLRVDSDGGVNESRQALLRRLPSRHKTKGIMRA